MSFDLKIGNGQDFAKLQHDIILDSTGRTIKLTGTDKLIQDILKIIFTTRNYFYKEYGTQVDTLIGTNLGLNTTKNFLSTQISSALTLLQFLQTEQTKYQTVNATEIISQVSELQVDYLGEITQNPNDNTSFKVTIIVINGVNQKVTVSRSVSLV